MGGVRERLSQLTLAFGAALVAAGSVLPAVPVETETSMSGVTAAFSVAFRHYLVLPVAACVAPVDGGPDARVLSAPGVWPARVVAAAGLASLLLVAAGTRRAALAATATLAASVCGLVFAAGVPDAAAAPPVAGWTAYPPLSAVHVGTPPLESQRPAFAALGAGAVLLAAAAWLRTRGPPAPPA
jgi:hypothetical protein